MKITTYPSNSTHLTLMKRTTITFEPDAFGQSIIIKNEHRLLIGTEILEPGTEIIIGNASTEDQITYITY